MITMTTYSPTERIGWYRDGLIWRRTQPRPSHSCAVCGEAVSEKATYCTECATSRERARRRPKQQKPCPDCGTQILATSARCKTCSAKHRAALIELDDVCGTYPGYLRHQRRGQEACINCKRAMSAYKRERRAAKKDAA